MWMFIFSLFASAQALDCTQVREFLPLAKVDVSISVDRIDRSEPVSVCATTAPLNVGVYDIRGREEEWYSCFYRQPRPVLECATTYRGQPAQITVRPAVVLRRFQGMDVRDTHAHIFMMPLHDPEAYHDTFVRALSPDLKSQPMLLDSVSGGRGPNADVDSYGVRLLFR